MSIHNYHPALTSTSNNRRYPSPPTLPRTVSSSMARVPRSPPRSSNSNLFGWQPPPGASHSSTGPHGDIPIPFARNGRSHPYVRPRASTYSAAGPSYGSASMFTVGPSANYRSPSPSYGLPSSLGPNRGAQFLGSGSRPGHAHRLSASRTPLPALLGGPLHANSGFDLGIGSYRSDSYADSPFGRPNPFPDVVSPSFMALPTLPILPMHVDPSPADHGHGLFGAGSLHHDAGLLYTPSASHAAHYPFLGGHEQEHTPEPQGMLPMSHTVVTHPHPPSSGLAHVTVRSTPHSPTVGITSFNVSRARSNSATLVGTGEDLGAMHSPPSLSGSDSSPPGSLYSAPPSPTQQVSSGSGETSAVRQGFELEPAPPTGDPLSDFWGALTAEANEAARGKNHALPVRQRARGVVQP
ncbi:unnamed protein product [Peniophora sp. CBMAI 1063]|nr:unnamed protein product [Peniophora sp. CBMAI 1063]